MQDKRKVRGNKTRKCILAAAQDILNQEGYLGLSTRQIAKKAGISQSSLYHHFSNVEEILFASLSDWADRMMGVENIKRFDNLHDFFVYLFRVTLQQMANECFARGYFAVIERASNDPSFREKLQSTGRRMVEVMKNNIKAIYGDKIPEERLDAIVFGFMMFREGYVNHLAMFGKSSPFGDAEELALKLFRFYGSAMDADVTDELEKQDEEDQRTRPFVALSL